MSASTALNTLSGDLAFSVAYGIATELLELASTSQYSDEELIAMVLSLSVLLASLIKIIVPKPKEDQTTGTKREILNFLGQLLMLAQRLAQSVSVQLLASSVRSNSALPGVRVLSLLSVALFFVFLESSSSSNRS